MRMEDAPYSLCERLGKALCPELTIEDLQRVRQAVDLAVNALSDRTPSELAATGSWQAYGKRAAALARTHRSRDAYLAFLDRDQREDWKSPSQRQDFRTALTRLGSYDLLEQLPSFLRWALANEPRSDRRQALIKDLFPDLNLTPVSDEDAPDEPLTAGVLKMTRFLLEVPPRAAAGPPQKTVRPPKAIRKKQSSGAYATLTALRIHERRKRSDDPDYCWRLRFWQEVCRDRHIGPFEKAAMAILMVSGARPSELSDRHGVRIWASPDGKRLIITVRGAKCGSETRRTAGKGQTHRHLHLRAQTPMAKWLAETALKYPGQRFLFRLKTPRFDAGGKPLTRVERSRRVSQRLGKLCRRIGKQAYPRMRKHLTPYVFRHALASDLRGTSNHSPEAVAQILGHQSDRTQQHYGSSKRLRREASPFACQIRAVEASDAVRSPNRPFRARVEPDSLVARGQGA
ncbi:site-specific integrase [Roseovarius sp. CH_XMU1461]|uniref:site-specific integrase n=1 Tax=Roseovarius sp. CH_XMU1461 TaxID=3107777 RepID=UPI0030092A8C